MFDIGWSELLVIGVVALIVIGPKDLPGMFRTLGRFTARAKAMAREFQASLEAAAEETGVKDVTDDLQKLTSVKNLGLDSVTDAAKSLTDTKFDPDEIRRKITEADAAKAAEEKKPARAKTGEKSTAAKKPTTKAKAGATKKTSAAKKPGTTRKKTPAKSAAGAAKAKSGGTSKTSSSSSKGKK
ncbi:MAG: Sec-independent protein translocase protein TatB [Paracoccaceae bacterium]|nr:Sec-independent protein translocase protein TatB [Paracoccaceae bacterium]